MSGPDLFNSLVGVLVRFKREPVKITGNIQQMFQCFKVREDRRNCRRFLWIKDNDFIKELIEYLVCIHVFSNRPSPATYGLQKATENSEHVYGALVKEFIQQNFYVDDGITSLATSEQAIDLMQRTRKALSSEGKLPLKRTNNT